MATHSCYTIILRKRSKILIVLFKISPNSMLLMNHSLIMKMDQLIEYGYLQSSIEYCLKYDVIYD